MHTLALIRHAVAEDREQWREHSAGRDDAQRPLTEAGHRQAERIAKIMMKLVNDLERDAAIVSLRSSPALRCIDTLRPLAKRSGVSLDIDPNLMEGREIQPLSPREDGVHIIGAHGDNIPWLLEAFKIAWEGRCKKGSIWLIQRDGRGKMTGAEYHVVPKD